jgi:hypothetical protein
VNGKVLIFVLAIASALQANADQAVGTIAGYGAGTANNKSAVVFRLAGQQASGCNTTARYLINTDSLHFQGTLASIIAAFHSGATVTVYYTPTCTKFENSFDASYICVGSIAC